MRGATPADVDYINAHGTSTGMNDRSESAAIHAVFGADAKRVAVSSTKSSMGHLIAAAGAVEVVVCALAIDRGEMPVNANYRERDPDCDLNLVLGAPRRQQVRMTLSNSFGFGGSNSCIVLRQPGSSVDRRAPTHDAIRASSSPAPARVCGAGHAIPAAMLDAIVDGRSAIAPIEALGHDRLAGARTPPRSPTSIARALVDDRKLHKLIRRTDMVGIYAGDRAVEAAGLSPRIADALDAEAPRRSRIAPASTSARAAARSRTSTTIFPLMSEANGDLRAFGRDLADTVNPMWLLRTLPNNVLCHVGIRNRLKGTNACITNHSVGGALAVIEATEALRNGEADRAVAIGHDTPIEPQNVLYYHAVRPARAATALRPFDARATAACSAKAPARSRSKRRRPRAHRGAPVARRSARRRHAPAKAIGPARDSRRRRRRRARDRRGARRRAASSRRDVGMIVAHGNGTRAVRRIGGGRAAARVRRAMPAGHRRSSGRSAI